MARSTYIYIVMQGPTIVAAFTVKHEMITWLKRNPGEYQCWQTADGRPSAFPPTIRAIPEAQSAAEPLNPLPTGEDKGESAESNSAPPWKPLITHVTHAQDPVRQAEAIERDRRDWEFIRSMQELYTQDDPKPPCSGGVLPTPKDINTSIIGGPSCEQRFNPDDGYAVMDAAVHCTRQTEYYGCCLLEGHGGAHYDPDCKMAWT